MDTNIETETKRGDYHVKMKTEIVIILPQAKDCLRLPELQEARKDPSLEALEGPWPSQYLDFGLPTSRTMREKISIVLSHPVCDTLWHSKQLEIEVFQSSREFWWDITVYHRVHSNTLYLQSYK